MTTTNRSKAAARGVGFPTPRELSDLQTADYQVADQVYTWALDFFRQARPEQATIPAENISMAQLDSD
jgi:hypothetical protein